MVRRVIQVRRGTAAEQAAMSSGDPKPGELVVASDTGAVYVGVDAGTAGGVAVGGGGGGSGDVVGPSSAVDGNLASFNTTTGKLLKDSGIAAADVSSKAAETALNTTHRTGDGSDHADVAANTAARHAESHTVASHSDTTATGAQLNELVGGGETALHGHADPVTFSMKKLFGPDTIQNNSNWVGSPTWYNQISTSSYAVNVAAMDNPSTKGYRVIFQVPDNWKTGSEISVDIGFAVSTSSPAAGNVDLKFIVVAHSFNLSGGGSEGSSAGAEYATSRSATVNEADVAAYSQTFVRKNGIVLTSDGSLGTGDIAAGDQLVIQFTISDGTNSSVTSSYSHVGFLQVNYTATDLKVLL